MTKSVLCEVRVDRLNEKGVFVAEQILNVLHNTQESPPSGLFKKHKQDFIPFAFEVANIWGVIRFFFSTPEEYLGILQNQIYAHFPNVEFHVTEDYLPDAPAHVVEMALAKDYFFPLKIYTDLKDRSEKETIDPLSSITSALAKATKETPLLLQVCFSPVLDSYWKSPHRVEIFLSHRAKWIKKILISPYGKWIQMFFKPFELLIKFVSLIVRGSSVGHDEHAEHAEHDSELETLVLEKTKTYGFAVSVRAATFVSDAILAKALLRDLTSSLQILNRPNGNSLKVGAVTHMDEHLKSRTNGRNIVLNSAELAGLVHLPTIYVKSPGINWVVTKKFEPPANLPVPHGENSDVTPIGTTNFRGTDTPFGLLPDDRRRHVYVIGKTGMGKSTLLENMIFDDINKGRWVGLVDPHGDLAEAILACIPKHRTNDVILFDPSDSKHPIAFNMLEQVIPELRPIVASGLVGVFKKIFGESWGPRLEHILRNTVMTLLEIPDATIMSIPLMLTMKSYRHKVVSKIKDPILKKFWESEFEAMGSSGQTEAAGPILNKVGQFLSSPLVRNIVGQPKNPFSLRWAMDNEKIVIINLSKGKIGEDSSALLGAMMITKFQIDAMSRADIPEDKRRDFYLYVDEFQNFATDSFATILSEARKYKLNLVIANQYIEQMNEVVQGAVFGNVGTLVSFQLGNRDAKVLSEVMDEELVLPTDLMNLRKHDIYTKLLIDGMPSPAFSATTYAPIRTRLDIPEQKRDVVTKVSREKYSKPVELVEKKIMEFNQKVVEDEKHFKVAEEAYKEKKKEERRKQNEHAK